MREAERQKAISKLNRELFDFMGSDPDSGGGLADFYIKHSRDAYLDAVKTTPGSTVVLQARDLSAVRKQLPWAMLLGDTVLFDCTDYARTPEMSVLSLPDSLASPVLYAAYKSQTDLLKDPEAGPLADPFQLLAILIELRKRGSDDPFGFLNIKGRDPLGFLGADWSGGTLPWERTPFFRTDKHTLNLRGEDCSVCLGFRHLWKSDETGKALLDELNPVLLSGRAAPSPFLRLPAKESAVAEGSLKARTVDGIHLSEGDLSISETKFEVLASLPIPYLAGVDLPTLVKVLNDEVDSVSSMRTELHRVLEDIVDIEDLNEARERVQKLKRDIMEDELKRVREACERLSQMNSLARIGAYVATGALTVGATLGLSPSSLVVGSTGAAMATINALYRNYQEKRGVRRSPMYFAWRFGAASG